MGTAARTAIAERVSQFTDRPDERRPKGLAIIRKWQFRKRPVSKPKVQCSMKVC